MMDITVVVATFGDPKWEALAFDRAMPSVEAQGVPVIHAHADTLHQARNLGLDEITSEWVCFLDADDELEPSFFDHMAHGTADVRAPSVAYVRNGRRRAPHMPRVSSHTHECTAACLPYGNWLVVGSVARCSLVRQVGGWRDWPMYEDWDLWLRCYLAGAALEPIPAAVYRAHWRAESRNRAPSMDEKNAVHRQIITANGLAA